MKAAFPLATDNPLAQGMKRFLLAMALVVEGVAGALFAVGRVPGDAALVMAAVGLIMPIVVMLNIALLGRGTAELHPDRLLVRSRGGNASYRWDHVADVRIATFEESPAPIRLLLRLMGVNLRQPFVKLRLSRSLRAGLFRTQVGTDVIGPPTVFVRSASVYVADPPAFVEEAKRFVVPKGS